MPAVQMGSFSCPMCGSPYDWRPEYVGRIAKCPCGHVLRVPEAPAWDMEDSNCALCELSGAMGPATGLNSFPLPEAAGLASAPTIAPLPNQPPPSDEDYAEEFEAEMAALARYAESNPLQPNAWRDRILPGGLLMVGFLIAGGQATYTSYQGTTDFAASLVCIAAELAVNIGLMLVGLLLAAKLAGISFGTLGTGLLKLCALYIGPSALGTVVTEMLGGDRAVACLGGGLSMVLYWVLFSYFFRLDGGQTLICVITVGAVRLAAAACTVGAITEWITSQFG